MAAQFGTTPTSDGDLSVNGSHLVDREGMRAGVDERLSAVLAEQAVTLGNISVEATPLIDAWGTLLKGGKRLRAAFSYWGYRAANPNEQISPDSAKNLHRIGAALELFQAAALFHDDVMDRSDSRRGNPTAHKAFEAKHTQQAFVGDAEQYGINTAILLGDLSLVASESEFRAASYAFPEESRLRAHSFFDTMRTTVTVGQFLDVHAQVAPWNGDFEAAKSRAFEIIRTKTSSYSVTHPILLGASLGGATQEELTQLENFAMPVGIAYQLFDDLLGVFGDPQTTGKPAGDDLREGKRTVLVLEALERLAPVDRQVLQDSLGNADLSDTQIAHLRDLIDSSGAARAIRDKIDSLAESGLAHLRESSLNPVGVEMLVRLARFALKREY